MLETYNAPQPVLYEDRSRNFDVSHVTAILKRRFPYFVIPFVLVVMFGAAIVEIQRPIYQAWGVILVESPDIPPDLVRPTIMELTSQRIEILKQRILARDNLIAVMDKFGLFPRERRSMSETDFLDLMRARVEIKPVELEAQPFAASGNPPITFTVAFDYEDPDLTLRVVNEFLTEILSEDASSRTNTAAETTKFLEQEVRRLTGEHDAVVARLEAIKTQPPDAQQAVAEEIRTQMKSLGDLETELAQKSSVYSDEYPAVKELRKEIAALKRSIAAAPEAARVAAASKTPSATDQPDQKGDVAAAALKQQESNVEKSLEDASTKLNAARLGESLERNQQSEHLRVVVQPTFPQAPIRPKKIKWFAAAFGLATVFGVVSVFAAEMLDGSIRGGNELAGIIDKHLIVTIPYLAAPGEEHRKMWRFILLCTTLVALLAAAIVGAMMTHMSIDFAALDRHSLTRLFP